MPTEPTRAPVNPPEASDGRRLHIHGIKEMPAGYDAEVAELFRDLRAASNLSEADLAATLATRTEVVQALEQGALYALPPWPETSRVVNSYGLLLNLDVRPLLRRIYAQLEAGIVELQPKTMPEMPMMTPPETADYGFPSGNSTNSGNAAAAAQPNPLDIPWPPPAPQAPPPQQRPKAAPQPQPQVPRPNAGAQPQPQNSWQQPHPGQQRPQAWPGNPPPQAPRPNPSPQARSAPPQPPQDRRQPQQPQQPRPTQVQSPPPPPQPQPMPPRYAPPPHVDADFGVPEAAIPEPEPKRRRPMLLKLGLGALIIAVVAFGLWFALSHATGPAGPQSSGSGTLDPDDPRSHKADRLPTPF
jgi:hypothetical protein